MLSFENDYSEGAHEKILQRLIETNLEQLPGYGTDIYCARAAEKIKAACQCPEADVYFLAGGTQTNAIVIDSMLAPYEGVIAAVSGHINAHEAGAVEYTGHKVLPLSQRQGKLDPKELAKFLENFWADPNHEHMVFPGMVYLSWPTEYGTLYSRKELTEISEICRRFGIPLYLDGARLGYGLASPKADLALPELAALCDAFYIGGTKVGALCGEAVVFTGQSTPPHFLTRIKQHGALPAKGRLLGIQFDTLFTDGLYFQISRHAIEMAGLLKAGLQKLGYSFYLNSPTNQQFVILYNQTLEALKGRVAVSFWEPLDETRTVVRFATSWATRKEDIETLMEILGPA